MDNKFISNFEKVNITNGSDKRLPSLGYINIYLTNELGGNFFLVKEWKQYYILHNHSYGSVNNFVITAKLTRRIKRVA